MNECVRNMFEREKLNYNHDNSNQTSRKETEQKLRNFGPNVFALCMSEVTLIKTSTIVCLVGENGKELGVETEGQRMYKTVGNVSMGKEKLRRNLWR